MIILPDQCSTTSKQQTYYEYKPIAFLTSWIARKLKESHTMIEENPRTLRPDQSQLPPCLQNAV
eukprot:c5748_g1_i1 orf=92-283(+)